MDEKTKRIADAYKKVYGDSWREMFAKYHWCVYDGGEIGSTGVVVKWSLPGDRDIDQQN